MKHLEELLCAVAFLVGVLLILYWPVLVKP